jgi:urease accessory protein
LARSRRALRALCSRNNQQIALFPTLIDRAADEDRVRFNLIGRPAIPAAAFFLGTGSASAHYLMGAKTPSTFAEGLLSGVGHPIIGPDYLAFLLALGIAVGVFRLSLVNPFLFVAAMICGVAMHVAGLHLPAADPIVPISVLIAGLMLIIEERIPPAWWMAVFVAAGLFHGYTYGDSIYGADAVPLIAYVIGLVAVQVMMTLGVAFATRGLWKLWSMAPRLAGAAFCGVGFAALVAQLIHTY